MESPIWHLCRSGLTYGPYTTSQLREWLGSGRVTPEDLIWRDGIEGWQQLARLEYILPESEQKAASDASPDQPDSDKPRPAPFKPPEHKPEEPEPWPFDDMQE